LYPEDVLHLTRSCAENSYPNTAGLDDREMTGPVVPCFNDGGHALSATARIAMRIPHDAAREWHGCRSGESSPSALSNAGCNRPPASEGDYLLTLQQE
jgi:hypothetical protein